MPTPNASKCRFHATSQFLFQYLTILYATFRKKSWDHENLHFLKNLQCFLPLGGKVPVSISEAILKNPCGRPWVPVFLLNSDLFFVLAFGMDHSTILDQEKHTPGMNNKHPFDTSIPCACACVIRKFPPFTIVTLRDHHHSILRFPGPPKHMPTAAATKNLKTGWRKPRCSSICFVWLENLIEHHIRKVYITYCKSIKTHM